MVDVLLAAVMSATAITPALASPSQQAFGGARSFGLHGCDPAVVPAEDRAVYCASVLARNRVHRSFGDKIQSCSAHAVGCPSLDPDTELSFYVARGTVFDLACQLSNLLAVSVASEDEALLVLKQVHWRSTLKDASEHLFTAEDGTLLRLSVDSEKNVLVFKRVVDDLR